MLGRWLGLTPEQPALCLRGFPGTRGCLIPALRKMQSENDMARPGWAGQRYAHSPRSSCSSKLLNSFLTCVHVRLNLRSMRARANHVRAYASVAARSKGAVRQTHPWFVCMPRIPLLTFPVSIVQTLERDFFTLRSARFASKSQAVYCSAGQIDWPLEV